MLLSPILAIWVLKEKMGPRKIVPIVVCTVGTILICTGLYRQMIGGAQAPEATPESALESTPESALESAPESALESAPESALESTPESTPESAIESALGYTPESAPESTLEYAPESAPEHQTHEKRLLQTQPNNSDHESDTMPHIRQKVNNATYNLHPDGLHTMSNDSEHNFTSRDLNSSKDLNFSSTDDFSESSGLSEWYGIFLSIVCGISTSVTYAIMKLLSDKVDDIMILSLWVSGVGMVLSLILMCIFESDRLSFPNEINKMFYLLIHVVVTGIGSFTKSAAIYCGSSTIVAIVCNSEIPLKMLCQYFVFSDLQPVDNSMSDVVGAIFITVGILIACVLESLDACRGTETDLMDTQTIPLITHSSK